MAGTAEDAGVLLGGAPILVFDGTFKTVGVQATARTKDTMNVIKMGILFGIQT